MPKVGLPCGIPPPLRGPPPFDKAALLLQSRDRRAGMVKALQAMAVPNAAEKIYETLREIMK